MGYDNQAANTLIQLYGDCQHDLSPAKDMATLYGQREIQFMGIWKFGDWRLKVYGIPFLRSQVRKELIEATRQVVPTQLPDSNAKGVPGVGFVVIHDAEDAGFVLIDWWANNIELHQSLFYSDITEPSKLMPVPTRAINCMYEAEVHDFERRLWLRTIRANPDNPDLDSYLSETLTTII
jgi:hypothetical protein